MIEISETPPIRKEGPRWKRIELNHEPQIPEPYSLPDDGQRYQAGINKNNIPKRELFGIPSKLKTAIKLLQNEDNLWLQPVFADPESISDDDLGKAIGTRFPWVRKLHKKILDDLANFKGNPEATFVARGIVHDIRNRWTFFNASYELWINSDYRSDKTQLHEMIYRGYQKLHSSINIWRNLINFFSGKTDQIQEIDLNQMQRALKEIGGVDPVTLDNVAEGKVNLVSGPLEAIMLNLSSNTQAIVKAGAPSDKQKWALYIIEDKGETKLQFMYWDRAGGYPEDYFDSLDQPLIGKTLRPGGTGMGMEIIKRMANLFGVEKIEIGNWTDNKSEISRHMKGVDDITTNDKGSFFIMKIPLHLITSPPS